MQEIIYSGKIYTRITLAAMHAFGRRPLRQAKPYVMYGIARRRNLPANSTHTTLHKHYRMKYWFWLRGKATFVVRCHCNVAGGKMETFETKLLTGRVAREKWRQ